MRRLEALETKEPVSVNQVSSTSSAGCTYCQDMNHVFEECPVFFAHQSLPEHMSAAFTRPANNPYSPTYNPGWRNHPNFSGAQATMIKLGPNSPTISKIRPISKVFLVKILHRLSKIHKWRQDFQIWKERWTL